MKPIFNIKPNPTNSIERTEAQKAEARKWMDEARATRKKRHPDLRTAPLRQVVQRDAMVNISTKPDEYEMNVPKWKLECGHFVSPPQDIYGERFPNKMRCGQCLVLANGVTSDESEK